jgi:superfamily II DNA or RNA helicase
MSVPDVMVPGMWHRPSFEFDGSTLRIAVSRSTYLKGVRYAEHQVVQEFNWDPEQCAVRGPIRGQDGQVFRAAAFLSVADGRPAKFVESRCNCSAGGHCSHVVALVLTALPPVPPMSPTSPRPCAPPAGTRPPGAWERQVDSSRGSARGLVPLAIGITLDDTRKPRLVFAQIVQPDPLGRWVPGYVRWGNLAAVGYPRDHSERHLRLLHDLYLLYRRSTGRGGRETRDYRGFIDLSAIDSLELWTLLDQAETAGLSLVYPGTSDALPGYREATFHVDVTRERSGGLQIMPVVQAGGQGPALPVAFIGREGRGAACIDRAQAADKPASWRFRLVRLAEPVDKELQQLTLAGPSVRIPADGKTMFETHFYPWLRRSADVISSDGSFAKPAICGPDLMLRACSRPDHELELSWHWAYQIGDTPLRSSLAPVRGDEEFRDPRAEDELLRGFRLPAAPYPLGFEPRPGAAVPKLTLTGLETMQFMTEVLPRLKRLRGLIVEVSGESADYRETGESLRITVSADEATGQSDWFGLNVTMSVEGRPVPYRDVLLALSSGRRHLLLPDGAYFSLDRPELRRLARLVDEARSLNPAGPLRISRFQVGLWNELAALGVPEGQASTWWEQVKVLESSEALAPTEPPAGLGAMLRPYQQEGFSWLTFLWQHRLGGILADEMGLGKTRQCLAMIAHARQHDPDGAPFLIVAPPIVVQNWRTEADCFAPHLNVVAVRKTAATYRRSLRDLAAGADVVVTTYTVLRLDFDAYNELTWSGLFLDEAQHVKNRQTHDYQCVRRLAAPVKFAITGTPLQNDLMELWSLLSITAPGLFPSPNKFFNYFARPIEDGHDEERLAQLQRWIRPWMLRRTKKQADAGLPGKEERVMRVDLHPSHHREYERRLTRVQQEVLGLIEDIDANRWTILSRLTMLRQLCLHAGLVDQNHADMPSAKIDALLSQLREVADGGHRALVFSQFKRFLRKVRAQLEAEGLSYCYIDGDTRDRDGVVRKFKAGTAPVFLISLKAGGFGMNLAEADHCFLLDPWWNPAVEAQAIDRIHRIGQTRDVTVCRLVARGTIEEQVLELQAGKAKLFTSVMGEGDVFGAMGADDIRRLIAKRDS